MIEIVSAGVSTKLHSVKEELVAIESSISALSLYENDFSQELERLDRMFQIGIDFEAEWNAFCRRKQFA